MRATSPQDALAATPDIVPQAQPKYPVGTRVDLSKVASYNKPYYLKQIRNTIIRRLRKTLDSLQADGYLKDMRGKKMLDCHKEGLRATFRMMAEADSVEVAGHAPNGMHTVGNIANQCYLCGGPGFSGTSFSYYFLFRKTDEQGRRLVYIYPEPLMDESNVRPCIIPD